MNIINPKFLRITCFIHGIYFISWALIFDFFVEPVAKMLGMPAPQTMIGWVAPDVAAGSLFTIAVMLIFASFKKQIPRFVLAVALVQNIINFYSIIWLQNKYFLI